MRNERALAEPATAPGRPVTGVRWRHAAGEQRGTGRAPAARSDAGRRSRMASPPNPHAAPYSARLPLCRSGQTSPGWSSVAVGLAAARRPVARRRQRDNWMCSEGNRGSVSRRPTHRDPTIADRPDPGTWRPRTAAGDDRDHGAAHRGRRAVIGFLGRGRSRGQFGRGSAMARWCAAHARTRHAISRVPVAGFLSGFLASWHRADNARCRTSSVRRWWDVVALRASFRSFPFARVFPGNPGSNENPPRRPAWRIVQPGSPIGGWRKTAGRHRFVRRGATGKSISADRWLTIRWRTAMKEWTSVDSCAAVRGFACRVSVRSAVCCGFAAGAARIGWCAEFRMCSGYLADFVFHVTNITDASWPWFVMRRAPAAARSAAGRPTADWRWPVRWRTVAE